MKMEKTLMHICCAPCANRPIAALREEGIEPVGFWFNPNITPTPSIRPVSTPWRTMPGRSA